MRPGADETPPPGLSARACHRLIDAQVAAWVVRAVSVAITATVLLAPLTLLVLAVSLGIGWGYRRLARQAAREGGAAALLLCLANGGLAAVIFGPPRPLDLGYVVAQTLAACCLMLAAALLVPLWRSLARRRRGPAPGPLLGTPWRRLGELVALLQVALVLWFAVAHHSLRTGSAPAMVGLVLATVVAVVAGAGYLVVAVLGVERGAAVSLAAVVVNVGVAVIAARTSPTNLSLQAVAHGGAALGCAALAAVLVTCVWHRLRIPLPHPRGVSPVLPL